MRIGVLDTWLHQRYLFFWDAFLSGLGMEIVTPQVEAAEALSRLETEAGELPRAARLVIARVLELMRRGVDYLLLPDIQLGAESERGAGRCGFTADLKQALLETLGELPPVLLVPSELDEHTPGLAASHGLQLTNNPAAVHLTLVRVNYLLSARESRRVPRPSVPAVGLVGEPQLVEDQRLYPELIAALHTAGLTPITAELPPARVRAEGLHFGLRVDLPTDLELVGSAGYLERRGYVGSLVLLADPACRPVENLIGRLKARLHKPARIWRLGTDPTALVTSLIDMP